MPRLPSIFEDDAFIGSLEKLFTKTAQTAVQQNPNDIQLALNVVNSFAGLPDGEIAAGSGVSRPGGISQEHQPGISDLYSLDAFVQYLMKNNFRQGGSPGGTGISIVAPAEGVQQSENSPYVKYVSKSPPGEFLVNRDGLIGTLKELATEAANSKDRAAAYLRELTEKLIDDATSNPQLNVPKEAFTAHKEKLDPTSAPQQSAQSKSVVAPATQKAQTTQINAPGEVASNDKTSPYNNAFLVQKQESGDAELSGHGIPSIWDWMPFWGNGTINFADIDNFIVKLDELVQNYGAQVGLSAYQWLPRVQTAENTIHELETEFNQFAPSTMKSMRGTQYDLSVGPIDAMKDFKVQFGRSGLQTTFQGQVAASDYGQIRVAQIMLDVVKNAQYLLQALTHAMALYKDPGFKEMLDAQINEAHVLEQKLTQLVENLQYEQANLSKAR